MRRMAVSLRMGDVRKTDRDGSRRAGPSLVVALGYLASFYCLSAALRTIPMGIAYAIWSGVGIVAISVVGLVTYRQKLDPGDPSRT